jgi:hypothetical protein
MDAPFAIDAATGRVHFPDLRLELRPLMDEDEFIRATAHVNRDNLGYNDGWQRYSIRELIPHDRKLGLFFIFRDGRLVRASLAYCSKDETWENWSEETEAARFREYQHVLSAQLGGKNDFPWGKANVIVDSKSGGTDIWIEFSN